MPIDENLWWWDNCNKCPYMKIYGGEDWNAHRCLIYGGKSEMPIDKKIYGGENWSRPTDENLW